MVAIVCFYYSSNLIEGTMLQQQTTHYKCTEVLNKLNV